MSIQPCVRFVVSLFCLSALGCRVSSPGKLESALIQWTKHHVTVGGSRDINPVHVSNKTVEDGKQIFASYCVVCHGRDGQNTGVPFATNMAPQIPPLNSAVVQSYSDGQLKWIVENGLRPSGMPASKGILTDEDMWTIVVYLRHLPPAGSLGEPRAYSGEEYGK
ncbi:c-type cytochrome [Edaphobacter albus]|uniref:c-type cytochrome n=1 Tax=Edaphobacter sp. 4G125 TaxID=2763071 RepID=UPI001646C1E9|nr:cytochrome c [Edaphobacter sp. 4G125]QNI37651.1 cytochrome c [Edaphobacter sp. 4G125]